MRDMQNLDFVRSVAVITVVVEHTLLAMKIFWLGPYEVQQMGVLGVLVFFVLTALVLMWSLERKPHTLDFYIRRVFRIYPLAVAVISVAVLLRAPVGGTPTHFFIYPHPTSENVVRQMTLVPNLFIGSGPQIVGVFWSLPYELEMYVLLPALFFFIRKNFAIWPLLLLWAMPLMLTHYTPSNGHTFEVAIGYFLPGCMAYVGFGRWQPRFPGWMLPLFLLGMWSVFWYRYNYHKAWYFCLIVGLALPLFRQMRSKWVLEPSRLIARYSYGIYVTHPFAIVIGFYLLAGHSLAVRLMAEAVTLVVLPVAAYHLLENPLIKMGARLAERAEKRYEQHELNVVPNET